MSGMSTPITTGSGFTDRRPGEPNGLGTPFFSSTLVVSGCGYRTAGFPPTQCPEPPTYAALVGDFPEPFEVCAAHAQRLRTAREPARAMWSL